MGSSTLLSASEIPTEMVLEDFFTSKFQDSVQIQTVLAMHEQENCPKSRNCHTMVRRHIDQMIGTCNFKARNERIETGVLVKSQKKREKSQR